MAPVSVFHFLLFSHLILLLSAGYGYGNHDNCPQSFDCGYFGRIHFPFTKAERQDCGLMAIYGCDDPKPKTVELEENGKPFFPTNVLQPDNIITVIDKDLHYQLLQSKTYCEAFNNNITLPPNSPLVSFYIKYNVTLFRCNHSLNVSPPPGFFSHNCQDYDIYYYGLLPPLSNHDHAQSSFSACSILQFPSKDFSDTKDLSSFLSAQMVIEVKLSDDCEKCYNHMGGQCRLDSNKNFYCDTGPPQEHRFHIFIPTAAKHRRWVLKLALRLGLGLGIGLLGFLIIWRLLRRHYRRKYASNVQLLSTNNNAIDPYSNADPESGRAYFGVPLFSYEELEKATNNFDCSRELGNGGFGTVYYGKLLDGREVAVKRLYNHSYRRVEQFMNEIEILTRLHHGNLVSLYGCTSHHSRELLLVYEYVPNRTVSYHLHGEQANLDLLPWPIRMKIAIETASALAYLHASDIIHRDVKSNNILLDNNFCVKVADFGLSRLFPNDVTHVSTAPQGTPGYVDPEYHQYYQLTGKSDVYSFGVVLIELISSMPAVDMNRHKDEINLANLAIQKIQKSAFGEMVDPSLSFESNNDVRRMIVSVAELAFQCLQQDKELRPSMDEVLEMLRRIESGKEEVDILGARILHSGPKHPPSPPSPDCDEIGLLKNIKSLPSPRAVIDKWDSKLTTRNASA